MKALIREAFLHIEIIGNHVVEGHYNLLGPDGGIVLPTFWEELIEPGWSVSMHMWPMLESPPERGPFPPGPPPPRQGEKHARELTEWMAGGPKYRSDDPVFRGSASPPLGGGSPTPKSLTSRKFHQGLSATPWGTIKKATKTEDKQLVHQVNNPGILDSIEIQGRDHGRR